ncbi:MAG: hypothetical protein RLZZ283_631 [Candidatus Parcubacteria bacterium]|jgi:hypothetical protein
MNGYSPGFADTAHTTNAESGECSFWLDRKHHYDRMVPQGGRMACQCQCGTTAPARGGPGA